MMRIGKSGWVVIVAIAGMAAVWRGLAVPTENVVTITSQRFEYNPARIVLKKGEPVVLELTSRDVLMGFNLPEFDVRADMIPGTITRIRFVPDKTGVFDFVCDVFCGSGHELMEGTIEVID